MLYCIWIYVLFTFKLLLCDFIIIDQWEQIKLIFFVTLSIIKYQIHELVLSFLLKWINGLVRWCCSFLFIFSQYFLFNWPYFIFAWVAGLCLFSVFFWLFFQLSLFLFLFFYALIYGWLNWHSGMGLLFFPMIFLTLLFFSAFFFNIFKIIKTSRYWHLPHHFFFISSMIILIIH